MIEHFAANDIELATHSSTFALQARDTLDGSITVRCPGTLTIHAAKKSFSGPTRMNRDHPDFPRGSFTTPVRIEFDHAAQGLHSAWQGMPYTVYADGARITEGVLDGSGSLLLDHSAATREYLVELANGVRYALPIDNAFADRGEDPLANTGILQHQPGVAAETGSTAVPEKARQRYAAALKAAGRLKS